MAKGVHIEGVEECLRMLDKAPENALKICRKAMKAGSKAVATQIRKGVPRRWRRLVRSKVGKLPDGNLYARAGLYNGKQVGGNQPKEGQTWDWFKAYWANYGTLSRRDPSHQFRYKVKPKSKSRRQDVGQPAQNFFEAASEGWQDVFVRTFENEVERNKDEIYGR